jgi:predicted nucleic acid-binding protein
LEIIVFGEYWLEAPVVEAKLYFDLHKKGITIPKSNYWLLAQVAILYNTLRVIDDSYFELIAQKAS